MPAIAFAAPEPVRSAEATKAVNAFAAAHHRLVPAGNALIAPWSIQACLGMVYAGAAGRTHDAMQKAFFYPTDETALHEGLRDHRQAMLAPPGPDIALNVRVANRIYCDRTVTLMPAFAETTRTHYSAEVGTVNFRENAVGATKEINQWVSDQTLGKIPAIIPRDLSPMTRAVLVNAVYFDLPWDERFTKELTQDHPFQIDATKSKTVPLMFKQHRLGYAKMDGFQIVALPYAGGTFHFVVILPDAVDGLGKVEAALTGELLSQCSKACL